MTSQTDNQHPVLAVDLGGTSFRLALVSYDNQIMAVDRHPTMAEEGPDAIISRIIAATKELIRKQDLEAPQIHSISIASAGAIDATNGIVTISPNLPGWHEIPLRDIINRAFNIDTFLINDANAAAIGEHNLGAGRGTKNLIYITVSTGIGSGIIIENNLYSGASGSAGEVGHMTIDVNGPRCNCGGTGCLEMLASGKAVAREAIRRINDGESSSLPGAVSGMLENITAKEVGEAAREGDRLAIDVITGAATYLGVGLANLVNILNPEIIVIGGGLSNLGDLLLEPARKVMQKRAFQLPAKAVRIVPSQLGDDAGILGIAVFARMQKNG